MHKIYCIFIFIFYLKIINAKHIFITGNDPYTGTINSTYEYVFYYNATDPIDPSRVSVSSKNANLNFPILVVIKQQKQIISWQLPLIIDSTGGDLEFNNISRTLCPDYMTAWGNLRKSSSKLINVLPSNISITLSTSSPENVDFTLILSVETKFEVELNQQYQTEVSPSAPKVFFYPYVENNTNLSQVETVLIKIESDSEVCMYASIQDASCPVYDLEHDIRFEGFWQTVSTRGGITVPKNKFPKGFFIVFVSKSDDFACTGQKVLSPGVINRNKQLTFTITTGLTYQQYITAVVATVCIVAAIYLLTGLFFCFCLRRQNTLSINSDALDAILEENDAPTDVITPSSAFSHNFDDDNSNSSLDVSDYDTVTEAESVREIFRTKSSIFVSDLARKTPKKLLRKSYLYLWHVLTVAVFYGLPVVQLVVTYQKVVTETGNLDLCYYNFLCAHPLGLLSDFNHVFSNLGYVSLGILFIIIVKHRERSVRDVNSVHNYGIPQHFGLFYSMGVALIIEGMLSASYHVCPNHQNFQFDSSFMYVISVLLMIKIYQNRHPDINATAYITFFTLALAIFIGMLGILLPHLWYWITFTVLHFLVCLFLTFQIYYMGHWTLDRGVFKRILNTVRNDCLSGGFNCLKPVHKGRMCLLLLGNCCNWALAIVGLLHYDRDFATYLLAIFMSNTLLYTIFYIVMKILHKETIKLHAAIFIILATVFWGTAGYFFLNKSISWALTPAASRQFNKDCKILNFYDPHDIWHFLSAFAMFFSFMILLTLDDDLTNIHRSKIHVF